MKKTLTILAVLLVAAFAVFAATTEGNTVNLKSTVAPAKDYLFTLTATTPITGLDASATGKTTFKINSDNIMNFGSIPAAIDIDITVSDWYGANLHEGNVLSITSASVSATDSRATDNGSNDGYSVAFTAGYNTAFEVGTFSVSWADKATLAADSYTATVTIAYTQV